MLARDHKCRLFLSTDRYTEGGGGVPVFSGVVGVRAIVINFGRKREEERKSTYYYVLSWW